MHVFIFLEFQIHQTLQWLNSAVFFIFLVSFMNDKKPGAR